MCFCNNSHIRQRSSGCTGAGIDGYAIRVRHRNERIADWICSFVLSVHDMDAVEGLSPQGLFPFHATFTRLIMKGGGPENQA